MINKIEKLKLLVSLGLIVSCTPNVNNTLPVPSKSNSPTPTINNTVIPTPSPSLTITPSVTSSITIPTATPIPSITPRPLKEIQKINVYSDDGILIRDNYSYKMLFNEVKTFKAEIVYKDGTTSSESVNWNSNNPHVQISSSNKIETSLADPTKNSAIITVSSYDDPNYKYNFEINLVNSLIESIPIYNDDCELTGYKQIFIDRHYYNGSYAVIDIRRTSINGKVFDLNNIPIEGTTVNAKSIERGVNWIGGAQLTVGGAYTFRDAAPTETLITVTKDGWTTRERIENLKHSYEYVPCQNTFNFKGVYAIQDEPEITQLKINGKIVTGSSKDDIFQINFNSPKNSKPTPGQMDNDLQLGNNIGNIPSLTGVNSNTLEVEMTFSEAVNMDDVKKYFRITSQSGIDNRVTSFTIDGSYPGVEFVGYADERTITFKTNKAILTNKSGEEARYLIDFVQPFRDKTGKAALNKRYFRFSNTQINDFAVFSVKNDEESPKLLNIVARDGGSANDTIELRYSKPMELINQASYSAGLADPNEPLNIFRQLWYRDANSVKSDISSITNNTDDNNATLVGFLIGSDSDTNQFRTSYMIGRMLTNDVNNGTPKMTVLGRLGRALNTTPVKGNTVANDLLRNARITGNNVLLEFSPTAFDRDDRVVVSVSKRIEGNYVDRNRTPSVNEELTVNANPTVEYVGIYNPAGRLIDTGNSSTSANIDVSNTQRVATAS